MASPPTSIWPACAPGSQTPVGGIAIVFNAAREFHAMLTDVLGDRVGMAAFVDASGRVVAASDERYAVGATLPLDLSQAIVEHDGAHLTLAAVGAGGYREFKHSDGCDNGIRAVVALRLGTLERRQVSMTDAVLKACRPPTGSACVTWRCSRSGLRATPCRWRRCLTPGQRRASSVGRGGRHAGLLEVPHEGGSLIVPVLCGRQLTLIHYPARETDGVILVLPAAPKAAPPGLCAAGGRRQHRARSWRGAHPAHGRRLAQRGRPLGVWHRAHRQRGPGRDGPGAADGVCGPGAGGRVAGVGLRAGAAGCCRIRPAATACDGRQPAPVAAASQRLLRLSAPACHGRQRSPAMAASRRLPWPPAVA